jgi:hypothetical protein
MVDQYPVFVIVRDRLSPLLKLLDWLQRAGQGEIWLIDNDSTYPPLVEFLGATEHTVVSAGRNWGHRAPWLTGTVQRHARGRFFVVTDPDVVPDADCPFDALDHFRAILEADDGLHKVGFGLRIDDLPDSYALARDVVRWESRFWIDERAPGIFNAPIDTTFALYRPLRSHRDDLAVRTGFPYVARHLPWYTDSSRLSEEDRYYRDHADSLVSNWDRDALPRWKRRWLDTNTTVDGLPLATGGPGL